MVNRLEKIVLFFGIILLLGTSIALYMYFYIIVDLPKINTIKSYKPLTITYVFGDNGKIVGEIYTQYRIPIKLDDMAKYIPEAFLAAEDTTFYQHGAVDWEAIFRAAVKDLLAEKIVQGGSTITQQLVKTLFLSPQKTITRKLKEFILAIRLEGYLTKSQILNLYLNQIYLGNGCYGVEAASEQYFHKKAKDLSLAEAAILAGLPKNPSAYDPTNSPKEAKLRQRYVIDKLVENHYITKSDAEQTYNQPVKIYLSNSLDVNIAPHFMDIVKQYLNKYGADNILKGGYKIYTTIDPKMQMIANKAIKLGLEGIAKKQGFPGPLFHINSFEEINKYEQEIRNKELKTQPDYYLLTPDMAKNGKIPIQYNIQPDKSYHGVVTGFLPHNKGVDVNVGGEKGIITTENMNWAHPFNLELDKWYSPVTSPYKVLKVGDVVRVKLLKRDNQILEFSLEVEPQIQGALIALDVTTGAIKAMVGSYDYAQSQFNHAIQAKRPVGSAFKPIYYSAALEKGYTTASPMLDAPVVFQYAITITGTTETATVTWRPKNFNKKFTGIVTLENALTHSKNNPSIRLLKNIGINDALTYAKRFGIIEPLSDDLSIALGSSSISLFDMVTAYNVFPNYGIYIPSYYIKSVYDGNTKMLEQNKAIPHIVSFSRWNLIKRKDRIFFREIRKNQRYTLDPDTAYLMISILRNVVKHGTGWQANALGRPAAGKTGTTEENRDAWFIGFTPNLITGVWVGFDDNRSLGRGETGGEAALPIWLDFMKKAVKQYPDTNFPIPPNIVFVKVDPKTGYLASSKNINGKFYPFISGTQPSETSFMADTKRGNHFFELDQ